MLAHRILGGDNNKKEDEHLHEDVGFAFCLCYKEVGELRLESLSPCPASIGEFIQHSPKMGNRNRHLLQKVLGTQEATKPIPELRQGQGRTGLPAPPTKCHHISLGAAPLSSVPDTKCPSAGH